MIWLVTIFSDITVMTRSEESGERIIFQKSSGYDQFSKSQEFSLIISIKKHKSRFCSEFFRYQDSWFKRFSTQNFIWAEKVFQLALIEQLRQFSNSNYKVNFSQGQSIPIFEIRTVCPGHPTQNLDTYKITWLKCVYTCIFRDLRKTAEFSIYSFRLGKC